MSPSLQAFLTKYKVFLTGLAGAIVLALNQFLSAQGHSENLQVYLYAALMAAISYIGTQWRGQGATIFGVIGTLATVFTQMHTDGSFTWREFIMYSVVAVLALVASPPKPLSYEHNPEIVAAKTVPNATVKDTSVLPIGGQVIKPPTQPPIKS